MYVTTFYCYFYDLGNNFINKTANFVYVTNHTQKSHVLYYPHLTEFLSLPSSSLWWPAFPDRLSFLLTPALAGGDRSWLAAPGDPVISNSSHSIPSDSSPNSCRNNVSSWTSNNSVGRTIENKSSCQRTDVSQTSE